MRPRLLARRQAGTDSRLPAGVTSPTRDCRDAPLPYLETMETMESAETTRAARRVSWPAAAVVAVALVYAWFASALRPFTHPQAVAVAIPIAITGIAVLRRRTRRTSDAVETGTRRGIWVWRALLGAFLAWELVSYRLSPRVDHPTISSIADAAMSTHPGRFAMFVAWLAIGYWLFTR